MLRVAGVVLLLLGMVAGFYLATASRAASPILLIASLAAHAVLFPVGEWLLVPPRRRPILAGVVLLSAALGVASAAYAGGSVAEPWLRGAHLAAGLASIAVALLPASLPTRVKPLWIGGLAAVALLAVLGVAARGHLSPWQPPRYQPVAAFRFLTATSAEQAGDSGFPAALQVSGATDCARFCHQAIHSALAESGHGRAASSPAVTAVRADFVRRRGGDAARWCDGCHAPTLESPSSSPSPTGGVGCAACHAATEVTALHGSASLKVEGLPTAGDWPAESRLWPASHARRLFQPELIRAPELCGSCHRKGYNLPQNEYRWMPGPDDFGEWQASRWSGRSLFAPGTPVAPKDCLGCHSVHGHSRVAPGALVFDAFLRPSNLPGTPAVPLEQGFKTGAGMPMTLDIVVENAGIGHAFPTGMPDLQESWLEVRAWDRAGRLIGANGVAPPRGDNHEDAHRYRLVALDRDARPVVHGDLDRMTAVQEWRRIEAGAADLARYELTVPASGLGRVDVRLLRRRRRDFARWAGEPERPPVVLATATFSNGAATPALAVEGERFRRYGIALAGVKDFPRAIQALLQATEGGAEQAELRLALGKLYLDQGDLLAAQEQFQRAGAAGTGSGAGSERSRAWAGAVQRRMGQPERAAELLEPLRARHPRDKQLLYELGHTYLALLRNREAAAAFQGMLNADPLDAAAHFGLMVSQQRLNLLTEARREETLYRLLSPPERQSRSVEARPLHVHRLVPSGGAGR